jgi:hypothetical protein
MTLAASACASLIRISSNATAADCVTRVRIDVDLDASPPDGIDASSQTSGSSADLIPLVNCIRPSIRGNFYHVGWSAYVTQWFYLCMPTSVRTDGTDCSDWSAWWPYTYTVTWCGAGTNAGTWADGGVNATVSGPLGSVGVGYRIKMTNQGVWSVSCWNAIC